MGADGDWGESQPWSTFEDPRDALGLGLERRQLGLGWSRQRLHRDVDPAA
jgi:hypothetical protein